jgi:hypothetical protein
MVPSQLKNYCPAWQNVPVPRRFMVLRRLLVLVWFGAVALAGFAGEGFVLVEPDTAPTIARPVELRDVPIERSAGGGRAFRFRDLSQSDDPTLQSLSHTLKNSRAFAQALTLLERARQQGPAPVQAWLKSAGPLPIWVIPAGGRGRGPGLYAPLPIRVVHAEKSFTASMLVVVESLDLPGKTVATPGQLNAVGLLLPMLCHEVFHAISAELFRERYLLLDLLSPMPGIPHDSPLETDPQIALKEGFAEAGELWLAQRFPADFAYPRAGSHTAQLLDLAARTMKRRIKLASRNRYIFAANGQKKDGKLKSGSTNLATEGVIASLLFTLVDHVGFADPWRNLFSALAHAAPTSFFELVTALIRENPEQAATIRRILLEYTCYTIADPAAMTQYERYYVTRKAFLIGKTGREEYLKSRAAWQAWKDAQREKIAAGAPLCEAVPQPLIVTSRQGYTLDLNDEQAARLAWHLTEFIPPEQKADGERLARMYAEKILDKRRALGTFSSVRQIEDVLPRWLVEKFHAGFRRSQTQLEKRLDDEVSRRRHLKGY